MTAVYKCDRCGAIVEYLKQLNSFTEITAVTYHLCWDCDKAFRSFMDTPDA